MSQAFVDQVTLDCLLNKSMVNAHVTPFHISNADPKGRRLLM